MKKTVIIASSILVALLCTACAGDQSDADSQSYAIRLGASILDIDVTRASTDVQGSLLETSEKIAVFIEEDTLTGQDPASFTLYGDATNHKSVYTVGSQSGDVMGMTRTPVEYYPTSGNPVNLFAWYPDWAVTSHTSAPQFTVEADQSNIETNAAYKASDLMYSQVLHQPRTSGNVNLKFSHLLTKVVIQLKAGEGFKTADENGNTNSRLADAKVELVGVLPSVDLLTSAADGNQTGQVSEAKGEATNIIVTYPTVQTDPDNDGALFDAGAAILPAQTFAGGSEFIRITTKDSATGDADADLGVLRYFLSDSGLTLAPGKVYTFTVTVNLTGISLTSDIQPWSDATETLDNNGNVSAGMDNN